MNNSWLLRGENGSGWLSVNLHDGISIDGSFLTPGTDTRTWWERAPFRDVQSWGTANQTYMTINAGNVGIGTTTPDYKLTVNGSVSSFTKISGDTLYSIGPRSLPPEVQGLRVIAKTTNNKSAYGLIGTAITSYDLENVVTAYGVYGTASAPSTIYGAFAGLFNGHLGYTGTFYHVSDRKLKENIKDLPSSIDVIMKIKPKTFSYKKIDNLNLPFGNQAGFIAQDIKELLPDLVNELGLRLPNVGDSVKTEIEKYMHLDYIGLIPYIVKSIQDQQLIIEKQNDLIKTILLKDSITSGTSLTSAKVPHIIKLYPNPAQTQLDIECFTNNQTGTIYIYDKDGKIHKSFVIEGNSATISLESFENGVYIVALFINGTAFDTKRFVVAK